MKKLALLNETLAAGAPAREERAQKVGAPKRPHKTIRIPIWHSMLYDSIVHNGIVWYSIVYSIV